MSNRHTVPIFFGHRETALFRFPSVFSLFFRVCFFLHISFCGLMAVCLATARCSRLLLIGESRSNRYLLAGFRTRLASSVQHHSLPRLQSRHYLSYLSLSVLVTKVHISQQLHKPQHIQQCTASSSPTVKHFSSLKMANTTASNGHCNEDSSSSVTHKITEMQIPVPWGGHLAGL